MLETALKWNVPRYINPILQKYFQVEFLGEDNLPFYGEQNCMFVMNHTAFFGLEVYLLGLHITVKDPDCRFKTLVWKGFTEGPMGFWFKSLRCEAAKIEAGRDMIKNGDHVLIMPEGVGATDVRNRFNQFHTGFLRMLQENPIPIVPIGFYGVDQSIPWLVSHNKLLVEKFMKPVDPNFDFFLLPKFPIFRPTKIVFNVGKPLNLTVEDLNTEEKIQSQRNQIQKNIEGLVDGAEQYREEKIRSSWINKWFHRIVAGSITNF